jgi:hypothetical protein
MIIFLHKLTVFFVKNGNFFAEFFGKNIFKNNNIGPWLEADWKSHYLDRRRRFRIDRINF